MIEFVVKWWEGIGKEVVVGKIKKWLGWCCKWIGYDV